MSVCECVCWGGGSRARARIWPNLKVCVSQICWVRLPDSKLDNFQILPEFVFNGVELCVSLALPSCYLTTQSLSDASSLETFSLGISCQNLDATSQ